MPSASARATAAFASRTSESIAQTCHERHGPREEAERNNSNSDRVTRIVAATVFDFGLPRRTISPPTSGAIRSRRRQHLEAERTHRAAETMPRMRHDLTRRRRGAIDLTRRRDPCADPHSPERGLLRRTRSAAHSDCITTTHPQPSHRPILDDPNHAISPPECQRDMRFPPRLQTP